MHHGFIITLLCGVFAVIFAKIHKLYSFRDMLLTMHIDYTHADTQTDRQNRVDNQLPVDGLLMFIIPNALHMYQRF